MKNFSDYKVSIEEIHHTKKLDAPSGTAITLADGIIKQHEGYNGWCFETKKANGKIPISAIREGTVPGTHTVTWDSEIDTLSLKHEAKNRKGFALGAVVAAEFIHKQERSIHNERCTGILIIFYTFTASKILHLMANIFQKKYIRFAIVAILYILVVIWIGNYWLLLGLGIIFDLYITEKVNWTFWKKRHGTNSSFIEWLDALIFAVIAVSLINIFLFQNYRIPTPSMEKSLLVGDHLFVSKIAYGPRMPNTPIAFPFTQHTMPITKGKSWSNLVLWDYRRLAGFGKVKHLDPIVFNFPAGDTVVVENQATAYYEIVRSTARELQSRYNYGNSNPKPVEYFMPMARKEVRDNNTIIYRPVDRRDNYVKRCIGLPGDTIFIKSGTLYINGKPVPETEGQQTTYYVVTNGDDN